jgi:hypothetical protein
MMDETNRLGKRIRLKLVWPAYLGSLRTYKYCCCEAGNMIGHNWNIIWDIIWYINIYIYMSYIVIIYIYTYYCGVLWTLQVDKSRHTKWWHGAMANS